MITKIKHNNRVYTIDHSIIEKYAISVHFQSMLKDFSVDKIRIDGDSIIVTYYSKIDTAHFSVDIGVREYLTHQRKKKISNIFDNDDE